MQPFELQRHTAPFWKPSVITYLSFLKKQLQHAMAQLQQIQKQHANQQGHQGQGQQDKFPFQSRGSDRGSLPKIPGGSSIVPPPMSLASLPLPLTSSAGGPGFCERPTPTKAQLTMPPRLNHKAPGMVLLNLD